MEFPELGKKCSWLMCKALDFLPLTCSNCKLIFCKDHITIDSHQCVQRCSTSIQGSHNQIPIEKFLCSFEECSSPSAIEMVCSICSMHFCLMHRYHNCFEISQEEIDAKKRVQSASKEQFTASLKEINKTVNEGIKKSLLNPRKQNIAQKLHLMQLKAKSKGPVSIPADCRIYFLIAFKKNSQHMSMPVFSSSDWSVGKVIDSVSDICGIQNMNNKPNAKRLCLFKRSNGAQISVQMSKKVKDLIAESTLANGETLILEYVDSNKDTPTSPLLSFQEYIES